MEFSGFVWLKAWSRCTKKNSPVPVILTELVPWEPNYIKYKSVNDFLLLRSSCWRKSVWSMCAKHNTAAPVCPHPHLHREDSVLPYWNQNQVSGLIIFCGLFSFEGAFCLFCFKAYYSLKWQCCGKIWRSKSLQYYESKLSTNKT